MGDKQELALSGPAICKDGFYKCQVEWKKKDIKKHDFIYIKFENKLNQYLLFSDMYRSWRHAEQQGKK